MQPLDDVATERNRILLAIRSLRASVARAVEDGVGTLEQGIDMLGVLRRVSHEECNQLLHEALIVEAASELADEFSDSRLRFEWNPRQTGPIDEPDLRGSIDGHTVLSVEASAAELPKGATAKRIAHTLLKLSPMPGRRLYCVRTQQMRRCAETKVAKAGYDIEVRVLEHASGEAEK